MNTTRILKTLRSAGCMSLLLSVFLWSWPASAAPVSSAQAQLAAERWLAACPAPLGAQLVKTKGAAVVGSVAPLTFGKGAVNAYLISLKPEGYLIVAGDTRLEPIVAFSQEGTYDPNPANPLVALLQQDLPARLTAVNAKDAGANQPLAAAVAGNEAAWGNLLSTTKAAGTQVVVEEWVPYLVQSKWSQGTEGGRACYNYYTPLVGETSYVFDPGNPANVVSGCAATATAQIIRYFAWPETGIGYKTGGCSITFYDPDADPEGASLSGVQLRGGNGNGGPYDWANMTLDPDGSESEHSLQQIGALCFDAGLSIGMQYNIERSGMSGASFSSGAFTSKFNYAGAGSAGGVDGLRANLDARRPVAITIGMTNPLLPPPGGGHAIVGDGYGRIAGRWYYHFNMGWGGSGNLWYNVEEWYYDSVTGGTEWAGIGTSVGNIYRKSLQTNEDAATGKIISGRITDAAGNPVPGVHVKIQKTGADFLKMMPWNEPSRDYTDTNGIWAIDKVPAGSYTVVLTKDGLEFSGPFEVTVGSSNIWGLNFVATAGEALALADWWYDYNNLMPGAAVVVLEFNRPIGAVAVDPTKLTINTYTLTGATTVFQSEGSPFVIVVLNAADTVQVQALTPPLALTMARDFLVADVDGEGTQAGEDDAATVPVAPPVSGSPEDTGLPIDLTAPRVVSAVPLVGGSPISSSANPYATTAATVEFLVTFSAAVSGVDASDLRVHVIDSFFDVFSSTQYDAKPDTPIPSAVITAVQMASATTCRVTVQVGQGDGYVRLDVIDDDTITNGTTALGGAGAHNGDYLYSPYAFHVDNLGPVIVAATLAPDNTYVTITWNEPVGGTNSLAKTSDFDDLTPVYKWRDTNGTAGHQAGDALWLDRGSGQDDTLYRRDDVVLLQPPFTVGLLEGQGRTGQFKYVQATVPLLGTITVARVCYVDSDLSGDCSSGDGFFFDVTPGLPTSFDNTFTPGSGDIWFWPTGSDPSVTTAGTLVPDRTSYYADNGAIPVPSATDVDAAIAAYLAWAAGFIAGNNNGVWLDYAPSASDGGIYTIGSAATGFVDALVLGTAPTVGQAGTAMPATAMFRDTNQDGQVGATDLIWLDTGSVADAFEGDGSDIRLDTNGAPLPGILYSNALQVLFKKNGGTVTSVGIRDITNGDGSPMTAGSDTIRAYLQYTPDLDLAGDATPTFLNEYRIPAGVETIEIVPVENSVFDALGNVADTQTTTGEMKLYDSSIPRVVDIILADDNYSAKVIFSERVYTNNGGIYNHGVQAVQDHTGDLNLTDPDFSAATNTGAATITDISYSLGTNYCVLYFGGTAAARQQIDPAANTGRTTLTVTIPAGEIFDFNGNPVPATAWPLPLRQEFNVDDPDTLPPRYFTNGDNAYRKETTYPTPVETNTVTDSAGLTYHGVFYRDLDGDCRVDAVDLYFRNPRPGATDTPTLNVPSASQFRVFVQNNDPDDTEHSPAEEDLGSYAPGFTTALQGYAAADWTEVSVTGASVFATTTYYSIARLTINQSQVRARTHGKRWVMVSYNDPTDGTDGVPPTTGATDTRERDGVHWYRQTPASGGTDPADWYWIVDDFALTMAWDGAPARPISATMWRIANYTKSGEASYGSYDYLDLVFSEPLSSVGDTGWTPAASYGSGSSVHQKNGPYGPEIIDLLSGTAQTVRIWFNNTAVTDRGIAGGSAAANAAVVDAAGARNATPHFTGTAIGVRNLDARYDVLGFSADSRWTDLLAIDAEPANLQQYSFDNNATTGYNHALSANRVTLRGFDQGGFTPNSDAYWRQSNVPAAPYLLAGNLNQSLGNTNANIVFAAAANDSRVTPGDAFVGGIGELRVYNSNLASNSLVPGYVAAGVFAMTPPTIIEAGPVYAMAKVNPLTTSNTSRLDEQERRVLGLDLAGRSTDAIETITVRFVDTSYGQFDPAVDLLPLADDATSGVRLYKTFGTAGLVQLAAGGLEWSDWQINDEGHPYREVVLRPLASQSVPLDDAAANGNDGYEYEIRVVTSVAFNLGDSFYAEIPDNGILFRRARSSDDFGSGWDTQDGTPGLALTDHIYQDANSDGRWGMGETVMDNEDALWPVPFYDAGVPYAHRTQTATLLSVIRNYDRNLYYAKRATAPNPDTDPEPPGAPGEYPETPDGTDTDYNVAYSPGDDVWYDIGGKLGVYDAGVDIPVVGNSDVFRCAWSPHEEGARSVQIRGAAPATVSAIASGGTVAAGSDPTAVLGVDMHDSGRTFGPRYPFGVAYGVVVEAVSKDLRGGTYTNAIAYAAAATTLSWRGGTAVDVSAGGRYLLADSTSSTFIVVSVWDGSDADTAVDLPAVNTTATLVVSADIERDVVQPAAIRGVRVHAVGPGNVPGKTGVLTLSGTSLAWKSDSTVGSTQGNPVDVSAGGMFVLSAERAAEDYLVVQVGQANGAASENLPIYSSDGRNITPFQAITGLDIVAVSSVIDQGTYRFTYDGNGSLSWADGSPTDITGAAGTQVIVPGSADGTAFVVVRRTAELLPDAATEDYLFINQARLLRLAVTVTDVSGFTSTHLAPLTADATSGIALFRDANANGVFDGPSVDEFVPLLQAPVFSGAGTYTCTLLPDPAARAAHLPNSHVAPAVGNDYFLTVRTTYDMSYGDRFSVSASIYEPTEPDANLTGNPSFASGGSGTIMCTSVTNTVYNDATVSPWTIDAGTAGQAAPVALFGVDHFLGATGTVYLQSLTFTLHSVNGFNPDDDLMAMDDANDALRGVMLYQDNGNGQFNRFTDTLIPCDIVTDYDEVSGLYTITLLPTATSAATQVPVASDGGLSDHFVCINLSPDLDYGDELYATVEVDDIYYSTGVGNAASRLTTHNLSATIASRYNDLTSRVQITATAGLVVNDIGSAVTDGYHQIALSFDPATGTYYLTWGAFTVAVDPTQVGTYVLGTGNNTITVTFDPQAFFSEDVLVDGDGTDTMQVGLPETALGTALLPLQGSSGAGGVIGDVYYVDVDLNGQFSTGDAIVLAVDADLVYDDGITGDKVILGTPVGGVLVAPTAGTTLVPFVAADRLAFADSPTLGTVGQYDDGEDIVRDTDSVYSLPWLDQVLDTDGNATAGIGPGSLIAEDGNLVDAATISLASGGAVPGFGGLYYFDADGSGNFSHGDDIIVRPAVGGVIPDSDGPPYDGPLTFAATDQVVFDGDDNWDGDDGDDLDERQVTVDAALSRFQAADYVAFEQGGTAPLGYEQREDIFRSYDAVYNSPTFSWGFRVTDGTRKIRRYEPGSPTPFNDPRYAMSAVIGLDIANSGATDVTLDRLTVRLINVYQFNATTDLRTLNNCTGASGTSSGMLLYRDADGNGVFDPFIDWLMPLAEVPSWTSSGTEYRMTFAPALYNAVTSESVDGVYDFFVVVQPDQDANNWQLTDSGDQFRAQINNGDLILSKAVNITSIVSDTVTIDSQPPQLTAQADINDADGDGYLDSVAFTFHEDLQPGNEDAGDWVLTDADGATDLSPAADAQIGLSANYRTLTIALADIAGTTGRITYRTQYDSDHFGLFDWAGNPVDFTAAGLVTADDVPPIIVHSGIVVEPTWRAPLGAPGTQTGVYYHDRDNNDQWDAGEDIWQDLPGGPDAQYDDGTDRRLWDGGDAWSTVDGYSNWAEQAGLYFYDEDGDGSLGPAENLWVDRNGDGFYDAADQQVFVHRGEEVAYLDLDGNGRIETLRVTFSEAVRDSTLSGFTNFWANIPSTTWFLAGRTNAQVDPNGPGAGSLTEQNNNLLYITFDEATVGTYDTDQTPDLTTVGERLQDMNGNRLNGGVNYTSGALVEDDQALPVLVGARGNAAISAGRIPSGTKITLTFSERMTAYSGLDLNDLETSPDGVAAATSPAFGGADATLTIDGSGNVVITLEEDTPTTGWTENATIAIAAGRPDHCVGDGDGHNPREGTAAVQIRGLGSIVVTQVLTLDTNANGYLDALRVTFDRPVNDASLGAGTLINAATVGWTVAGRAAATTFIDKDGFAAPYNDATGNAVLYVTFAEAASPDTGAKPALTIADTCPLRSFDNEPVDPASVPLTSDGAAPQIMDVATNDQDGDGNVDIARLTFSENMDDASITADDYTIGGKAGAFIGRIWLRSATYSPATLRTTFTTVVRHGLEAGDLIDIGGTVYPVVTVPSTTTFTVAGDLTAAASSFATIQPNNDEIVFISTADGDEAAGTAFQTVAYAQDYLPGPPPTGDVDTADTAGNLLASTANAGLRDKADYAKPVVMAVDTLSSGALEITFSEPVGSFNQPLITANRTEALLGGSAITFGALDASANPVIVLSAASATWNTGATGTDADDLGTDSTGADKSPNKPDLYIGAGAVVDLSAQANAILATHFTLTTDGAAPVIIAVATQDTDADGRVDRALVDFSEQVAGVVAAQFRLEGTACTGATPDAPPYGVTFDVAGGVTGTDYAELDYVGGSCSDIPGNLLLPGSDLGLVRVDDAAPCLMGARTVDDQTVFVSFSEALENSGNEISAAAAAGEFTLDAAATTLYAEALRDDGTGALVSTDGAGDLASFYLRTTPGTTWNTDAIGTDDGTGYDSTGTQQTTLPQVHVAASSLADSTGNALRDAAYDQTADGAPPVVLDVTVATGQEGQIFGVEDNIFVKVYFSEALTYSGAGGTPTLTLWVTDTLPFATAAATCTGLEAAPDALNRVLAFTYTVQNGNNRVEPNYLEYSVPATSLQLNGAVVRDLATSPNAADTLLPAYAYSTPPTIDPATTDSLTQAKVEIDTLPPTLVTARTMDDNTVEVTFSEPIGGASLNAAVSAGQITLGGGLTYGRVSADAAGATALAAGENYAVVYLQLDDGNPLTDDTLKQWNTDATGSSAGAVGSTDSSGTARANVPAVNIVGGVLQDRPGNTLALTAFTGTTDGATPVLTAAVYRDANADGRVDRVDFRFSEPVDVDAAPSTWTLTAHDLALDEAAGLTAPVLSGDLMTLTVTVTATAAETGVDNAAATPEVEPEVTIPDAAVSDRAPADNALPGLARTLVDQAGPAIIAATVVMPSVIEVAFSEKLDEVLVDPYTKVIPADFGVAGNTVTAVTPVAGWAGARLTLDTVLGLSDAPAVGFSAVAVVTDPETNGNQQTLATDPRTATALAAVVRLTGPAAGFIYVGTDPVDVTGLVDVVLADLSGTPPVWELYFVEGHEPALEPEAGWVDIATGGTGAPVPTPGGKLGEFVPATHADNDATQNWSVVLRVTFADDNSLDVVLGLIVAKELPEAGTVNDGLALPDLTFQSAATSLSGNWTGVGVAGVTTNHYEVAYSTDPAGYPADPGLWTVVPGGAAASSWTLPGLTLGDATAYYFKVRAMDSLGNPIAMQTSNGVTVDTTGPAAGTVNDGAVAGVDLDWQASDSTVAATWQGFADPGSSDVDPVPSPLTGSGIAKYQWAIFRQAGGSQAPATDTQVLPWEDAGAGADAANLGAGGLTHGQVYYVGVRALDAVGNSGPAAYSDGFRPDLVAPLAGAVRDTDSLFGSDIDITASRTTLYGSWDPFAEPDSGLQTYQYRVVTDVGLATSVWTQKTLPAQGALNQGRIRFGNVRLADGRVMVIGGWTGVAALASVEIYNPATGAWTLTGSLRQARYGCAAVALPGGDVVVAGGSDGSSYLRTIERYNHTTGTWSQIVTSGGLSAGRENAAAALMSDGTVWVAGGRGAVDTSTPESTALNGYYARVDRIDLATNTVASADSLSQARAGAAAYCLADGRLLVFGGETVGAVPSTVADLYTPGAPGAWSSVAMPVAHANFAHVQLPDGDLLAIGGTSLSGVSVVKTAAVDRFDTATGTWSSVAPMAAARANLGAAWVESTGTVLVAGGISAAATFQKTCEEYDPDNDLWTASAALNRNRGYHAIVACGNGTVMALGGIADWLITGETEVRRFAAPISAWQNAAPATSTTGTVSGLSLELGRTYYFQVRAFDNVGNRSAIATSDGVTVSNFARPPAVVTLAGPTTPVAVGEMFNVLVYVREDSDEANGFRGGPLDLSFTAACAQVTVDGGFTPAAVLNPLFAALLTSGTLDNGAGLINELGGATTADDLGEGAAPGVLYATIPFRATAGGLCTLSVGPGLTGLVLTPPIGVVPTESIDYGDPLVITVEQGVTLSAVGGATSVAEGSSYQLRASLSATATEAVAVVLAFSGSAGLGTDYMVTGATYDAGSRTLTIGSGASSATVTVSVVNDGSADPGEVITVGIESVSSTGGGYAEVDEQSVSVSVVDSGTPGDANGDGLVTITDLYILISEYGIPNPGPEDLDADFDGDGDVDYYDLLILIANFTAPVKNAPAAMAATGVTADDTKATPSAVVTLSGPASVRPGEVFNVDLYVQVDDSRGFGGGPLDVDFTTAKVDYSGTFTPSTIIQAPFNSIATAGTLNEAAGQITELGGGTIASGHGYGTPALYARMTFVAMATGTATFTASAGTQPLLLVGGTIPYANTTYGTPLTVTIASTNHAPAASNVTVQGAVDQPLDITLSGTDADGDTLTYNLPSLGTAGYPAHGDLSNSRAGTGGTRLVTYTPDAGYSGTDSFTYTVSDGTATSAAATVNITIGGFLTDVTVARGGSPFATLRFGMQSGASDAFLLAEGDYLAAPAGIAGETACLQAPYGELLAYDIRGLADDATWKLAVGVPGSGTRETWTLSWASTTLPDGYECTMTPANASWQPSGSPVDMTTTTSQSLANGSGTLVTYRFLVTVSRKATAALGLKLGWNLIGMPFALDDESQVAVLDNAHVIAIYEYATATGYAIPATLVPGRAYWLYADAATSIDIAGMPVSGSVDLAYGWNLVAPYTDSPNPTDGVSVVAVWAWDPETGYYIPSMTDPQAIAPTTGVWVFATEATTIWDSAR